MVVMDYQKTLFDPIRLAVLADIDLLDSSSETFDRLTRLAHAALGVPVALCNLILHDRIFVKAHSVCLRPSHESSRSMAAFVHRYSP
jgi:hypothetical protein